MRVVMRTMLDVTSSTTLLARVAACVPDWSQAASSDESRVPVTELAALRDLGALTAPLPMHVGGLGLGTEPAGAVPLLKLLRAIGRANLSLGRIFEGHVNAIKLVTRYGTAAQLARVAADAEDGHLFAIWATDDADPVRIDGATLAGRKTFCSASRHATRAVITAGDRMILAAFAAGERTSGDTFQTHGMQACDTGIVDFSGLALSDDMLIGAPGDYLRQPDFSAGAWRASAVALGGLDALVGEVRAQLIRRRRDGDPHQQARLGEILIAQETAALWAEKAAAVAESDDLEPGDVAEYVNLARIAIESACLDAMRLAQRSLGLAAFLRPNPVERLLRDLATYLRQPAPDMALTEAAAWFTTREMADAGR